MYSQEISHGCKCTHERSLPVVSVLTSYLMFISVLTRDLVVVSVLTRDLMVVSVLTRDLVVVCVLTRDLMVWLNAPVTSCIFCSDITQFA